MIAFILALPFTKHTAKVVLDHKVEEGMICAPTQ